MSNELNDTPTIELCHAAKHCTTHHHACDCREYKFRCIEINYDDQCALVKEQADRLTHTTAANVQLIEQVRELEFQRDSESRWAKQYLDGRIEVSRRLEKTDAAFAGAKKTIHELANERDAARARVRQLRDALEAVLPFANRENNFAWNSREFAQLCDAREQCKTALSDVVAGEMTNER